MPDLSPDTLVEIREFGNELIERFTPPDYIPGCTVKDISDKDEYDTDNGWIECIVREHNQQRCRWRGQVPGIQVNDVVDVMYFKSYRLFVVFGQGGTGAVSDNILNNYAGTVAPAVTDDSGDGYSVGSHWIDVTNDNSYQLVNATAGSAVWVQTNGGGAGAYTALADYDLTGASTSGTIDFTSISGSYDHLEIIGNIRLENEGESTYFAVRFNNDSGSNYDYLRTSIDGAGTVATAESSGGRGTSGVIGIGEGTFSTSNVSSPFRMTIPNYVLTDMNKTCFAHSSAQGNDASNTDFYNVHCSVTWHSTSAITRVTFIPLSPATNFEGDCHMTLYGVTNST